MRAVSSRRTEELIIPDEYESFVVEILKSLTFFSNSLKSLMYPTCGLKKNAKKRLVNDGAFSNINT